MHAFPSSHASHILIVELFRYNAVLKAWSLKVAPVVLFALLACRKTEDVPAYVEIPTCTMSTMPGQGAPSTKITDVWVSVNGTFAGVWELPARIPVLASGEASISVVPAIKRNGLFDDRLRYPFYRTWEGSTTLAPGTTSAVEPGTAYLPGLSFWLEPFDAAGTLLNATSPGDTLLIFRAETDPALVRDGSPVGGVELTAANGVARLSTDEDFERASGPVFLELDYSTDVELDIGLLYAQGSFVAEERYVTLVPTTSNGRSPVWNKAYIDLSTLWNTSSVTSRDLFFEARLGSGQGVGLALLDNIKIVRFE